MKGYSVQPIKREDAIPWIMKKHYAKRMCPVSYSYGLFKNHLLEGICIYGKPCSDPLRKSCGIENINIFYELVRLFVNENNIKNLTSYFVSKTLKLLSKPKIIVSFADPNQNHFGYIYQATNWIYTGVGSSMKEYIKDGHSYHNLTLIDFMKSRGIKKPLDKWAIENGYEIVCHLPKHRYFYFLGSKKQKKQFLKSLTYKVCKYPKGESKRYDASAKFPRQVQLF